MRRAKELESDSPADPSPFERYAYSLKSQNKSYEDIAGELNCTPAEARLAAQTVELWIASYDNPIAASKIRQQAITAASGLSRVLIDAQRAEVLISPGRPETTVRFVDPETKAEKTVVEAEMPPIYAADHQTRLEAAKQTVDAAKAFVAAGPSTQIAIGINNNQPGTGNNGLSFESRVRLKRQELGLDKPVRQLAAGDDEIVDGDVIDTIDDETGEAVEDDTPDQTVDPNEELADEQIDELTSGSATRVAVAHTATGT